MKATKASFLGFTKKSPRFDAERQMRVTSFSDPHYVMVLVDQSLELQLGEGSDA